MSVVHNNKFPEFRTNVAMQPGNKLPSPSAPIRFPLASLRYTAYLSPTYTGPPKNGTILYFYSTYNCPEVICFISETQLSLLSVFVRTELETCLACLPLLTPALLLPVLCLRVFFARKAIFLGPVWVLRLY